MLEEFWTTSALHGRNSDAYLNVTIKDGKQTLRPVLPEKPGRSRRYVSSTFAFRGRDYEVHPETHQVPFTYNPQKPSTAKARDL